ncbi:MAG: ABC transporter permease [Bacteroidota bacterium]
MENKKLNILHQLREGIHNTLRIWIREYQLILKDAGVMLIIFGVPVIYPLLYSFIYSPEVIHDLPIAVVDLSHSSASRQFIRNLDATRDLKVTYTAMSMNEATELFKKQEVRGVVQIPETFSADIALKRQATISAYANMGFFMHYKALMTGTSQVALETGNQIQIKNLENDGFSIQQAEVTANPLKLVENAMANPGAGFAGYSIPMALILIIQQTLVLAIGILAGTARERHPFGTLVPMDRKRMGTLRMVVGKTAAYFSIYALLCVFLLGLVPHWFGYARSAGLVELMALITPFLLSSIFFGMTLSVIFKNRESPMMLYLFTSIPLLFLSGIIWPLSNFGSVWLAVREIFPSSNAIFGYIKMNSLGASISETSKEIVSLWIQAGIYFVTACITYGYQVYRSEQLRGELSALSYRTIRERIRSYSN